MGANNAKIVTQSSQTGRSMKKQKMEIFNLNIATLKIGQSYSPLEFYPSSLTDQVLTNETEFDKKLNQIFRTICAKYDTEYIRFKKEEQIKLKYLNKITKNRFTPLFNSNIDRQVAGIKEKVFLMTEKEFEEKWDKSFEGVLQLAKKEEQNKKKDTLLPSLKFMHSTSVTTHQTFKAKMKSSYSLMEEVSEEYFEQKYQRKLKILDLMSYHSLLAYVYDDYQSSIDQLAGKNYNFKYKCFMENLYASERNSLAKRIQCIINYLKKQDISILFLQEMSENGLKLLVQMTDEFRVSKTHFKKTGNFSGILIRKDVFDRLEPNKTHWTLGALNARYLDNFQEKIQDQIPSPIKTKSTHADLDIFSKTSRTLHSTAIGRMIESNSSHRRLEEDSSSKIYVNEEEMQIEKIDDKKLKEQFQIIESAQRYSRNKKLQPLTRLGIVPSKIEKPLPKIKNSLKKQKKGIRNKIGSDFLNALKFPQNTVIQFIGSLILISAQIQQENISIKQKNIEDVLKMVQEIKEKFPQHTVVMGLDIDSDLEFDRSVKIYNNVETLLNKGFHSIPNLPVLHKNENPSKGMVLNYFKAANTFTINYTKTNFQFDRKNVEQKVIGCNNFIISTERIEQSTIQTAKGEKLNFQHNLPNKDHPFINYFVKGKILHRYMSEKDEN